MKNVVLSVAAIILCVMPLYVNALTAEERDAERADALFTKKESHQVLTAEETKWYSDYIKKSAAALDREKTLSPQMVIVTSNIASSILRDYKARSGVRKVTAILQIDGPPQVNTRYV